MLIASVHIWTEQLDEATRTLSRLSGYAGPWLKHLDMYRCNLIFFLSLPYTHKLSRDMRFSNTVVCATSKVSDQPAHTRSLIRAFAFHVHILWLPSYWPNIIWTVKAAQARLSLLMSTYHIIGSHMSRLIYLVKYYCRTSIIQILILHWISF